MPKCWTQPDKEVGGSAVRCPLFPYPAGIRISMDFQSTAVDISKTLCYSKECYTHRTLQT